MELDGVSLSDHFDIGNFSNATRDFADTGLIGQVEVLRGPASAVYGSSALGGVVAMQTLQPAPVFRVTTSWPVEHRCFIAGSMTSRNTEASVALRGPGRSLLIAGRLQGRVRAAVGCAGCGCGHAGLSTQRCALVKLVGENRLGHDWQLSVVRQTRDTASDISSVLGTVALHRRRASKETIGTRSILSSAEYRFDVGPHQRRPAARLPCRRRASPNTPSMSGRLHGRPPRSSAISSSASACVVWS